jgi:iron complex transport system ATP-binding protein
MNERAEPPLRVTALRYGPAGTALGGAVSFEVSAGSIVAVLGANGAGKTTLFRTLLGAVPAVGGEVFWAGKPVAKLTPGELARSAAWVPQHPGSGFDFTVTEYVMLGALGRAGVFSSPSPADRDAAHDAIADLGLAGLQARRLSQLSGGERQLAAIARALVQRSQVLMLDEPTASLDLANQARVLERLATLAGTGLAVVFSTHEPNHALQVADSVLLLRRGDEARFGLPTALLTPDDLYWTYAVRVQAAHTADGTMVIAGSAGGVARGRAG